MHWASQAVLNVFASLAQDVKRLPLILVGIFRTFELQSEEDISSSLISIARTGRLWRMDLPKLSEEETTRLILEQTHQLFKETASFDPKKLYRFCGGIPLYAVELSRFLEEGRLDFLDSPLLDEKPDFTLDAGSSLVPPLMERITKLRLSKLPESYVDLLKKASLLIGNFSLELICKLVPLESEVVEDALVDLEQRNFLSHREDGDRMYFSFNHQMVKLAIAQTLTAFERRRLFKAIIDGLEMVSEGIGSDRKAYYYYHSGNHTQAIPFLLASAESWLALGDRANGLQYSKIACKIALDKFSTDPETLIKVVLAHANNLISQGSIKEAIDLYNNVIGRLESARTSSDKVELLAKREELKELLKAEPFSRPLVFSPLALVKTKRALANTKLIQEDVEGAKKLLEEAEERLNLLNQDSPEAIRESGMILQVRARILLTEKDYASAVRMLSNAMELLLLHGISTEIAETWRLMGEVYLNTDRLDYALEAFTQGLVLAEQDQNFAEQALCLQLMARVFKLENAGEDAEQHLRRAVGVGKAAPELGSKWIGMQLELVNLLIESQKKGDALIIIEELEDNLDAANNTVLLKEVRELRERLC